MMQLQRLNLDSSWFLKWEDESFVIDPWLIGSEIDGFSWLNEQWHIKEPVQIEQLPSFKHLLISQSYEDHCHLNTLAEMKQDTPIFATPKAHKRLQKKFPNWKNKCIPDFTNKAGIQAGNLKLWHLHPGRLLDPIYFAVLIANESGKAVFYSPHGFKLNPQQEAFVKQFEIELFITTFTEFKLPSIMGGLVNPGMKNVLELLKVLKPKYTINTHDEQKKAKGLVSKLAKINWPDYEAYQNIEELNFIPLKDYQPVNLKIV